jgi:predicted  nucleic acid-binding Zn-ribbon protein
MNELMRILIELQSLEFEEMVQPNIEERIAKLRAKIPKPILSHYDRLGDQGKKGVVPLRNQTCTGCHMRATVAVVFDLKHGEDVCLCENCGRYLYLPEITAETGAVASQKPAAKNHRKQPAHAL